MPCSLSHEGLDRRIRSCLEEGADDRHLPKIVSKNRRRFLGAQLDDSDRLAATGAAQIDHAHGARVANPAHLSIRGHEAAPSFALYEPYGRRTRLSSAAAPYGEQVGVAAGKPEGNKPSDEEVCDPSPGCLSIGLGRSERSSSAVFWGRAYIEAAQPSSAALPPSSIHLGGLRSAKNRSLQELRRQAGSDPQGIVPCKEFRAGWLPEYTRQLVQRTIL